MNAPCLESDATLQQTGRIADILSDNNVTTEIIVNEWGEQLAVVARDVLDPHATLGSVRLHQLGRRIGLGTATDQEGEERFLACQTLPIAGTTESLVLPASFMRIIDFAVQAAIDRPGFLATELNSLPIAARNSDGRSWLNTHIDYSTQLEDEIANRQLSGLNIHLTRSGSCTAVFGLVRSFADVRRIGACRSQDSVAMELGAPFTEPVELRPGDAVIFQAGPHEKLGRLPVSHDFLTTGSETRYSELYSPTDYAPAATVLSLRKRIARKYHLESLGYAAA